MPELTIIKGNASRKVPFEGTPLVDDVLIASGFETPHPCGGHGKCGKCAVALSGAVSEPDEVETKFGKRLSCRARLLGDATVTLAESEGQMQIEMGGGEGKYALRPMSGRYGGAVDIGTTTVAVKVYDLTTGECVGSAAAKNPQTAVAADVMGRIEAAMKGQLERLRDLIHDTLRTLLTEACPTGQLPDSLAITGNTTMLYLLCGRDPTCLSAAPFRADTLFDTEWTLFDRPAYLPPCMNAFVGADITCAILASGMCDSSETALLCDIGTNGEIALLKDGKLYVTSTAAGPAFEGAGISCGCGSVPGAIDRAWSENGEIRVHTIGDVTPTGLCGSGLIDAIATGLTEELIDETGALDDPIILHGSITLEPRDVRSVQLAKAAIAAGITTLLQASNTAPEAVKTLYIAGGFGSHLDIESAVTIGLLPAELASRAKVIGNAALHGTVHALLDRDRHQALTSIAALSTHVNLGGDPRFNENYIECMMF